MQTKEWIKKAMKAEPWFVRYGMRIWVVAIVIAVGLILMIGLWE